MNIYIYSCWLCLASHRQGGYLETAPPLTVPCSVNTQFRPGIEPRTIAWQSITQPLRHASSIYIYSMHS